MDYNQQKVKIDLKEQFYKNSRNLKVSEIKDPRAILFSWPLCFLGSDNSEGECMNFHVNKTQEKIYILCKRGNKIINDPGLTKAKR